MSLKYPSAFRAARVCMPLLLAVAAVSAMGRCADEKPFDTEGPLSAEERPEARARLQGLVHRTQERSQAIGAARLLADAAEADVEETLAAKKLQAGISGSLGTEAARLSGVTSSSALQARASLGISQLIYDGGRTDLLASWRKELAESARLGQRSQQDQIALSAVSLALERSRWQQQVEVYGQYARTMSCLLDALNSIVQADRGRASELVQARKSLQQAELSLAEARSQETQAGLRLARLVGPQAMDVGSLQGVLLQAPPMEQLAADAQRSFEIAQLRSQAVAATQYAQAVRAGNKPQLSWNFTGGQNQSVGGNVGPQRSNSLGLGLALNIPLVTPGLAPAVDAAQRRAEAASLQLGDALEGRLSRLAEVSEQSRFSFERARRTAAVLRDSETLRGYTQLQWQQLGRRSLFDVMGTEAEHYALRVAFINALHDGQQMNAMLRSMGSGIGDWLR